MKSHAKAWDLIVESGPIKSSQLSEIRTQFEHEVPEDKRTSNSSILKWLRDQKRISEFQMKVLAGGMPGPFRYESYQIHAREDGDSLDGSFRGVHAPSGHPVRLMFFGGEDVEHAQRWAGICNEAKPMAEVRNRFVHRLFETVEDGEYRFVVTEFCKGQSLNQKLPYKGRLPWPQTLQAAEQIGLALTAIHEARLVHGRLWPGAVWLLPGGYCKVLWQLPWVNFDPDAAAETQQVPLSFQSPLTRTSENQNDLRQQQRNDLFAFGAVLFRLLYGKPPKIKQVDAEKRTLEIDRHIEALAKHEIPESFLQVVRLLLAADVNTDLKDAEVATKLIGTILESQSTAADIDDPPKSLADFEKALNQKHRSEQFVDQLEGLNSTSENGTSVGGRVGDRSTSVAPLNIAAALSGLDTGGSNDESKAAVSVSERVNRRRTASKQNKAPIYIAGGILALAAVLGITLGGVFSSPKDDPNSNDQQLAENENEKLGVNDAKKTTDQTNLEGNIGDPAGAKVKVAYRPQNIIPDDGNALWQSPTENIPLLLQYMPAAPEIVMSFRPARLTNNPQAAKFIQALGPRFNQLKDSVFGQIGVKAHDINRMIVSLHTNEQNQLSPFVVLQLKNPADRDAIWDGMGNPGSVKLEGTNNTDIFQLGSFEVYFDDHPDKIHTICFAPSELIRSSIESSGLAMADRTIQNLVERGDGDRDVNLIFRNSILFSEQGIWLFDGPFAPLRRPLSLFFDDRIQATSLSLHFDGGLYLELMTEQSTDFPLSELVDWIPTRLSATRNELNQHVGQLPSNPYWASIQQRFDNMLNELVDNSRTATEQRKVVSNCWLPESAAHNLVAAGELVLNANDLGQGTAPTTSVGPQTLTELLSTPRDLVVTTNPDLINLLRDIEQEIRDDYPKLPFDFRIKLLGKDLAVEGITQNQRPGEVRAENESLEQILAKIMLQANPDKSAKSPSDPNCKLIWVVGPDPDNTEKQVILVTTRKAANERNMTLPKVFQPE